MISKEKIKFRTTKVWKEFRLLQIANNNSTCQICRINKANGLHLHHFDELQYTKLIDNKFMVLCSSCHKELERLKKRKVLDIDSYCKNLKEAYLKSKGY